MQQLTFVGLSEDGATLTVALPDGRRFALPIDERLRAAVRGSGRTGQMVLPTEALRPRDVQARLRAGASLEEVAEQAGWSLDRVEAFAVPVLQERSFIAQQATASMIRHLDGESPLGEVVRHRLAERGVDVDEMRWDAWRTDDATWTVLLAYPAGRNDQVATWTFDADSRTLQPVDDEARWLSEYRTQAPPPLPPAEPDEPGAQIVNLQPARDRAAEQSMEQEGSRHPARRRQQQPEQPSSNAPTETADQVADPPSSGKRASVPSWDEILFGSGQRPEDAE